MDTLFLLVRTYQKSDFWIECTSLNHWSMFNFVCRRQKGSIRLRYFKHQKGGCKLLYGTLCLLPSILFGSPYGSQKIRGVNIDKPGSHFYSCPTQSWVTDNGDSRIGPSAIPGSCKYFSESVEHFDDKADVALAAGRRAFSPVTLQVFAEENNWPRLCSRLMPILDTWKPKVSFLASSSIFC